ncbi:MAG: hypothetical protein QM758_06610 [Armatimonas sp.]
MQEYLSIDKLLKVQIKFGLLPRDSFLLYGGRISEVRYPVLYHVIPSKQRIEIVRNIKYFVNKVHITSCNEAKSFIRLKTSPMLEICMEDYLGYEILIKEEFQNSDWLGEKIDISKFNSGFCAVISRKDAEKSKLSAATCVRKGTYKISRYIFQRDQNGKIITKHGDNANIILYQEEVNSVGEYRITKKAIHKGNVNLVNWSYPIDL